MSAFDPAVDFVLRAEGGLKDADPFDPGGLTNMGISRRAYPDLDIVGLTREAAVAIYRKDYWTPLAGDQLPAGIALMAFDGAVNQGAPTIARLLQQAVGVHVDGVVGPETLAAVAQRNADELLVDLCVRRALAYADSPRERLKVYGRGWYTRLVDCYRTALLLS